MNGNLIFRIRSLFIVNFGAVCWSNFDLISVNEVNTLSQKSLFLNVQVSEEIKSRVIYSDLHVYEKIRHIRQTCLLTYKRKTTLDTQYHLMIIKGHFVPLKVRISMVKIYNGRQVGHNTLPLTYISNHFIIAH